MTDTRCDLDGGVAGNREALNYRDYYEEANVAGLEADGPSGRSPGRRKPEDPSSRRNSNKLLVVCLGYGEHPSLDVHRFWQQKLVGAGADTFRFVYLQLTPKPAGYAPYEFFYRPAGPISLPGREGFRLGRGNAFDTVRTRGFEVKQSYGYGGEWKPDPAFLPINITGTPSEFKSELFYTTASAEVDFYGYVSRFYDYEEVTIRQEYADFTSLRPTFLAESEQRLSSTAAVSGRYTTREAIDTLAGFWYSVGQPVPFVTQKSERTYYAPLLSTLGQLDSNLFRFERFDINGQRTLQKTIESAIGESISSYSRVVIEAGPLYRDHYVAAINEPAAYLDYLSPIGTLQEDAPREAELYEKAAINLLPALARLGSDLIQMEFQTMTALDARELVYGSSAQASKWSDRAFRWDPPLGFGPAPEELATYREAERVGFSAAWPPTILGSGIPAQPLVPVDPALQQPEAALYGSDAQLGVFAITDPAKENRKVAVLVPVNIPTLPFPNSWFTAGEPSALEGQTYAQRQRYTSDFYNPLMRCYAYVNAMAAMQLL